MKETGPCCEWPEVILGSSFLLPWAAPTGPAALLPTGLRGKRYRASGEEVEAFVADTLTI
jgi:hypothetical protein